MPAGLNQDNPSTGLQAGVEIGFIPVPSLVSDKLTICIFARSDWIIDDNEISPSTRDSSSDTCCKVFSSTVSFPTSCRLTIRRKSDPKNERMFGYEISDSPSPLFRKFSGVARSNDTMVGMLSEMPRCIKNARIC